MAENEPNPAEAYQNLLKKHNDDANAVALKLFGENFDLRGTIRDLKKSQPTEGAVILTAEEARKWNAFNELGKEPKDIKASLDKLPNLETENQRLSKRDSLRDIAATGWDLELLEQQLEKYPTATVAVKKVKGEKDEETPTAFITVDGKESSLEEFGKENFPKLLPVLKVSEPAQTKTGATYDPNPANPSDSLFENIRKEAEEKKKNAPKVGSLREIAGTLH